MAQAFVLSSTQIFRCRLRIARLEFAQESLPSQLDGHVPLTADASKRRKHHFARITPEPDTTLNRPQLQGTDMAIVIRVTSFGGIQRVRLMNPTPDPVRTQIR